MNGELLPSLVYKIEIGLLKLNKRVSESVRGSQVCQEILRWKLEDIKCVLQI